MARPLARSRRAHAPYGDSVYAAPRQGRQPEKTVATRHLFDPYRVKRDFPILNQSVNGRQLIWLDNAATTQKPQSVIDRLAHFYEYENSNIHRAAHTLAARATDAYEEAREKVRRFLKAPNVKDIIFVRGATEGINLVAQSWGRRNVREGDEIVVSHLEHHANIVPWQMLCSEKGAKLRVAPVDDRGALILDEYEKLLGPKTRIVAVSQVSNALGTITPVQEITAIAHRYGACVLVDGAQSVSHMPVDVQSIGCDFFVFSGHKVFGPTGIGVVYGKDAVLEHLDPWQGGGNMIADVTFEKTIYQGPPERFEAGTGNIADAVGLGAALDYVEAIGMEVIARYEHDLLVYATEKMTTVPGLTLIGTAPEKASVLSFTLDGHDFARGRQSAGSRGDRRPLRPSLCATDPAPLRPRSHRAAVARLLQHMRGRRRAGQRAAAAADEQSLLASDRRAVAALVVIEPVTGKIAIGEAGAPVFQIVTVTRRIREFAISRVGGRPGPSIPAGRAWRYPGDCAKAEPAVALISVKTNAPAKSCRVLACIARLPSNH